MTPHKPLIIGAGYLGTLIAKHYPNSTLLDYPEIDITNAVSIRKAFETYTPDLIVNCAAWTNTATAELPENQPKVFSLNVEGPALLSMIAAEHSAALVHFSTAMMFDGLGPIDEGWTEIDIPMPTNFYAQTKYWADNLLLPAIEETRTIIFRIHTPISRHSSERNFLNRLLKFDKAINIPTSVTIIEDLLPTMDALLKEERWDMYNAVNEGTISAYDLAMSLFKAGHRESEPLPLTREELNAMPIAHQTFPILSTKKLADTGYGLPDVWGSVADAVKHFA